MACQFTSAWETAPAVLFNSAVICLPPESVSQVLSSQKTCWKSARFHGGVIALRLNPYRLDYRVTFAFSSFPYPPSHRLALRLTTLAGGRRAYHVPRADPNRLGPACSPVAPWSVRGEERAPLPGHLPFGSSPSVWRRGSPLGLSVFTTFSSGSHPLTMRFNPSSRPP